jgi:hypothetical protein
MTKIPVSGPSASVVAITQFIIALCNRNPYQTPPRLFQ